MRLSVFTVADQREALKKLADLTQRGTVHPLVRETALAIINDCADRDDECELEAIYNAVKHGTDNVPFLKHGLKYVADPGWADHFTAPWRVLEQLQRGVNGEDCDGHAALVAALAGAIGFKTGLRAWGEDPEDFVHVYAVAGFPKRDPRESVGLDTTVEEASVGWEPPIADAYNGYAGSGRRSGPKPYQDYGSRRGGHILTAWLD